MCFGSDPASLPFMLARLDTTRGGYYLAHQPHSGARWTVFDPTAFSRSGVFPCSRVSVSLFACFVCSVDVQVNLPHNCGRTDEGLRKAEAVCNVMQGKEAYLVLESKGLMSFQTRIQKNIF